MSQNLSTKSTIFDLSYISHELTILEIILKRPVVQVQIVIIIISLLLSWLLARKIWKVFSKKFPKVSQLELSDTRISWHEYGAAIIRFLIGPIMNLIFLQLSIILFQSQNWLSGYIADFSQLIIALIVFRIFIISLYALFPANSVKYYQHRFFAPLFILTVTLIILNWFIDIESLSRVALITLFGQPLTLQPIFVTFTGLYFWIVGLSLFEKVFIKFLTFMRGKEVLINQAISIIVRYFLIGLGMVLIAGYVGISPTAIAAITGGLSVGIGFGLKEVISNFVSGIWLLFEGSLKPGDYVKVNGEVGKVIRLGIRATTFQILKDNSQEIIPNQKFFTDSITPVTGNDNLVRRSLTVSGDYECNPQNVLNCLLQIADQHPQVLQLPTPTAFVTNFGDSSIDYELRFWIDNSNNGATITSELMCEIWTRFAEDGISIPFPQREIYIKEK